MGESYETCIVVQNGAGKDVCADETCDSGCPHLGGHLVTRHKGYQGRTMMEAGDKTTRAIGRFAPCDFEIRLTDRGSDTSYPFHTHLGLHVPRQVWDRGDVGLFGVNDTMDDRQLVGATVSTTSGGCKLAFGVSLNSVQRREPSLRAG